MTDEARAVVDVVDAHHHLWPLPQFDGSDPVAADALPLLYDVAEYRQSMRSINLVGSVHVETGMRGAALAETQWLAGRAVQTGLPNAIVAHADLADSALDKQLERQCALGPVRGIRARLTSDRAALSQLKSGDNPTCLDEWRRGYARLGQHGLSFELQATYRLLSDAAGLADLYPDTPLIISHAAFPYLPGGGGLEIWQRALGIIAARPNVILKLSGLAMDRPNLSITEIDAVLGPALELFGPERIMFGSNFPVDCRALTPETHLKRHLSALAPLSADDRARILVGTARGVYRL